ncbi:SRPBCC family protein [Nocardia yunnanensis]|uniref:SRPBCC family protein n=1 Tax=Nocardia yunnanensis TaxID=2382165 RepID=UPI001CA3A76E|nr:SRPBCC domain-containing protein [Nocardia yunnanensis]
MADKVPDAVVDITVPHSPARVWSALTEPAQIAQYFFGTEVVTDWQAGSAIRWRGEWQGKQFEDHGTILEVEPRKRLTVTHFSPLTGQPDIPENYHTVTYALAPVPDGTSVTIIQSDNKSEAEATESEKTWRMVLDGLARFLAQDDQRD